MQNKKTQDQDEPLVNKVRSGRASEKSAKEGNVKKMSGKHCEEISGDLDYFVTFFGLKPKHPQKSIWNKKSCNTKHFLRTTS